MAIEQPGHQSRPPARPPRRGPATPPRAAVPHPPLPRTGRPRTRRAGSPRRRPAGTRLRTPRPRSARPSQHRPDHRDHHAGRDDASRRSGYRPPTVTSPSPITSREANRHGAPPTSSNANFVARRAVSEPVPRGGRADPRPSSGWLQRGFRPAGAHHGSQRCSWAVSVMLAAEVALQRVGVVAATGPFGVPRAPVGSVPITCRKSRLLRTVAEPTSSTGRPIEPRDSVPRREGWGGSLRP